MHYPLVNSLKVVAWFLAVAFLTGETVAQTEDYSKPRSHLPNLIAPYSPRHVPEPNFANSSRIDQLVHEGKLMLSLDDAIALALRTKSPIYATREVLDRQSPETVDPWLKNLDTKGFGGTA